MWRRKKQVDYDGSGHEVKEGESSVKCRRPHSFRLFCICPRLTGKRDPQFLGALFWTVNTTSTFAHIRIFMVAIVFAASKSWSQIDTAFRVQYVRINVHHHFSCITANVVHRWRTKSFKGSKRYRCQSHIHPKLVIIGSWILHVIPEGTEIRKAVCTSNSELSLRKIGTVLWQMTDEKEAHEGHSSHCGSEPLTTDCVRTWMAGKHKLSHSDTCNKTADSHICTVEWVQ